MFKFVLNQIIKILAKVVQGKLLSIAVFLQMFGIFRHLLDADDQHQDSKCFKKQMKQFFGAVWNVPTKMLPDIKEGVRTKTWTILEIVHV